MNFFFFFFFFFFFSYSDKYYLIKYSQKKIIFLVNEDILPGFQYSDNEEKKGKLNIQLVLFSFSFFYSFIIKKT